MSKPTVSEVVQYLDSQRNNSALPKKVRCNHTYRYHKRNAAKIIRRLLKGS